MNIDQITINGLIAIALLGIAITLLLIYDHMKKKDGHEIRK